MLYTLKARKITFYYILSILKKEDIEKLYITYQNEHIIINYFNPLLGLRPIFRVCTNYVTCDLSHG